MLNRERVTIDPIAEDSSLTPLDLVGLDPSWGIYLLGHEYPPPDLDILRAGSADTEGDPVVQNRYLNRTITEKVRIFEPSDPASTNLATNPLGALGVTGWGGVGLETGPLPVEVPTNAPEGQGIDTAIEAKTNSAGDYLYHEVAVTNAKTYRASIYVQLRAKTEAAGLEAVVFNAAGAARKATGGRILSVADTTIEGWYRLNVLFTADATATWRVGVAQTGAGTTTLYATGVLVEVDAGWATRTNDCPNPYAAADTAYWSLVASANYSETALERKTDWGLKADGTIGAGGTSFRLTGKHNGTNTDLIDIVCTGGLVEAGDAVTVSAFAKTIDPAATTDLPRGYRCAITWRTEVGASLGTVDTQYKDEGVDGERLFKTAIAPAGTHHYEIRLRVGSNTDTDVVDVRFTAILGESRVAIVDSYFPTPPQLAAGEAAWSNIAHESASYLLTAGIAPGPFFCGDTPGCDWSAARHASTSTRPAPDGTRFSRIYRDLTRKLDRINKQRFGYLRRISALGPALTYDLRNARILEAPQDLGIQRRRAEVTLAFEALPFGRAAEELVGEAEEKALPFNILTAANIPGDGPALGRLSIEDREGKNQLKGWWGVKWGETREFASTEALFFEAEGLTPLGSAVEEAAGPAGASGGKSIKHPKLLTRYQGVLSLKSKAGAYPTHKGTYRVLARVWYPNQIGTMSLKLSWAEGDFTAVTDNDADAWENESINNYETWRIVDLGLVELSGDQWDGRILAKTDYPIGNVLYVDCVALVPVEASGRVEGGPSLIAPPVVTVIDSYSVLTEVGAITGKAAEQGGVYAAIAESDADDFQKNSDLLQRVTVSDTGAIGSTNIFKGRGVATPAEFTDVAASLDFSHTITGAFPNVRFGFLLNYVNDANFIFAGLRCSSVEWLAYLFSAAGTQIVATRCPELSLTSPIGNLTVTVLGNIVTLYISSNGGELIQKIESTHAMAGVKGKVAVYDENQTALAATRNYDNLAIWTPLVGMACFANQSLEILSDQVRRRSADGTTWQDPADFGDHLLLRPSGPEQRPTRVITKLSRGRTIDPAIDDQRTKLYATPRFLMAPPT